MTAANASALSMDTAITPDAALLERVFAGINRRYFKSQIVATVRWEIPKGTVSLFTGTEGLVLKRGRLLHKQFTRATELLQAGHAEAALPYLQECADAGHPESELLVSHLLKKAGDERWLEYATAYNRHLDAQKSVPAACYYPDTRIIALHPYLRDRKAPQLVLKYLVYHECCHQLIKSTGQVPHPPTFMEWEKNAPGRQRAHEWLEREGFPTLAIAEHD